MQSIKMFIAICLAVSVAVNCNGSGLETDDSDAVLYVRLADKTDGSPIEYALVLYSQTLDFTDADSVIPIAVPGEYSYSSRNIIWVVESYIGIRG